MSGTFRGFYINQNEGGIEQEIKSVSLSELAPHEVLIRVHFSSLNYKDALSANGNKGVTRKFPHIPGIDAAGVVERSSNAQITAGSLVLVTGYDLGMNTWGGFGEYISVPASWVIPLPAELSLLEAMSFGTAGFTAGMSVDKIVEAGINPSDGPIVVSGATGGVGSMSIAILSQLGFDVCAVTGKPDQAFLHNIVGAKSVMQREAFFEKYNSKPLSSADFAAGIDTVGGEMLSSMLKSVKHQGVVTSCGHVSSPELHTSVFPFILRGVTLAGIDSAEAKHALRVKIWNNLATIWKPKYLGEMVQEIDLNHLADKLDELLQGKAKGRYVLRH